MTKAEFNSELFSPVIYPVEANARLLNKEISELAQDQQGFIWLGTRRGLFRFDGYEYKKINFASEKFDFANIYVRALLADQQSLWIGSMSDGMFHLDLTTYQVTQYIHDKQNENSLSGNQVNDFALDKSGALWVGNSFGLDKFDPIKQVFSHYRSSEDSVDRYFNYLIDIELDNENNLWLATGKGLAKLNYKTQTFKRVFMSESKQQNLQKVMIRKVFVAKDGQVWLATQKHGSYIISANKKSVIHLPMENPEQGKINTAIVQPNENEIWISGAAGIEIRDAISGDLQKVIKANLQDELSLSKDVIYSMLVSESGLVWLGVRGVGLQFYNPQNTAFKRLDIYSPKLKSLFSGYITKVIAISATEVLVIAQGLATRLNLVTGEMNSFVQDSLFKSKNIISALKLNEQSFLLGTNDGEIIRYDLHSGQSDIYHLPLEISKGAQVGYLVKGKAGQVWVTSDNRLYRLDLKTMTFETMMSSQEQPFLTFVRDLLFDSKNRLWIATVSGFGLVEEGSSQVEMYTKKVGTGGTLSNNFINQILENNNGEILINTRSGINKVTTINQEEILLEPFAAQASVKMYRDERLLALSDSTYWLGLGFKLDKEGKILAEYGVADGALDGGRGTSMFVLEGNEILHNSSFGIEIIEPSELKVWDFKPQVVITEAVVGSNTNVLDLVEKGIYLQPEEQGFSVRFASLDFSSPRDNNYRYQLEGYDDNWVETPAEIRLATYTSLPPGIYHLLLDGTNRKGLWSALPIRIKVVVEPSIYQTIWFRTVLILFIFFVLYLLFQWRLSVVKRSERAAYEKRAASQKAKMMTQQMEQKNKLFDEITFEKQKADQANNEKSRFMAAASHDLRQPLNSMGLFIYALRQKMQTANEESMAILQRIDDAHLALSDLFEALLEISQLDSGTVVVEQKSIPLNFILQPLVDELSEQASSKQLSLSYTKLDVKITTDPLLLSRVLRNLIGNAIKYTDQGHIEIIVSRANDLISIKVTDTGIGIPEAEFESIFDEYQQLSNEHRDRRQGIGLGLSIVKKMCDLLDHQIKVSSQIAQGSTFEIIATVCQQSIAVEPFELITAQPDHSLAGTKVLVIDDEPEILAAMQMILSSWQCEVNTAEDYIQANKKVSKQQPDIILCDYRLQDDMNGLEVLQALQLKVSEVIPAIIITGETDPHLLKSVQQQGLKILNKPINATQLMHEISRLLIL